MSSRLVSVAVAAALGLAISPAFAQTQAPQTNQPAATDEKAKPQQNSADESAPRGTLEAGKEPTGHSDPKVIDSNKKLEEAAEKAKK
jgi:hypothetical protein